MNHKACDKKKQETSPLDTICNLAFCQLLVIPIQVAWIRGKVDWYCGNYQTISGPSESSGRITGCFSHCKTGWWQLKYFWNFHPYLLGEDEPILTCIFFKGVGEKPPTRKRCWFWVVKLSEVKPQCWPASLLTSSPHPCRRPSIFGTGDNKKTTAKRPLKKRKNQTPSPKTPMFQLAFFENRPSRQAQENGLLEMVYFCCVCAAMGLLDPNLGPGKPMASLDLENHLEANDSMTFKNDGPLNKTRQRSGIWATGT